MFLKKECAKTLNYYTTMEYQKITNLLGKVPDNVPRFITKKWIEIHDQSGTAENRYKPSKQIRFKTSMLRSDLCDFSDGYIVVTGKITVAEDLYVVMPMYNLIEYSKNYRKTTGSLWNYYRDEPNSGAEGNINYSIKDSESFDYKTSITGKLEDGNAEKDDVKVVVPLKYLSNFWKALDMPLINCEVSLALTWSEKCVLNQQEMLVMILLY